MRVRGYSAAKATVENLTTQWLAMKLARNFEAGLRVNALAPGFFVGEQNRALLLEPNVTLMPLGWALMEQAPAGRFGELEELVSTVIWLCGSGVRFVTGTRGFGGQLIQPFLGG